MQRKLLRWLVVWPFVLLAAAVAMSVWFDFPLIGRPPENVWLAGAWWVAEWSGRWIRFLVACLVWPVEVIGGIRWEDVRGREAAVMVGAGLVVWSAFIPAALDTLRLWDWFSSKKRGSVSQELHALWVKLRDWFEEITGFGKGPAAKWAGMADMKARRWRRGDIFLGRPWTRFGGSSWPVGLRTEKHMVTIAGTGSGKSTAALVPNLCLHEGSLLCIDPKGELARITADKRRERLHRRGWPHVVYVLDPFRISGQGETGSYNPFDEMEWAARKDPDRAVSFAARIAEALVKPTGNRDSYWEDAAKTLLTGLVLYVFVHEPEDRRTLMRLRELLMQGDVEGYEAAVAAGVIQRGDLNHFDFLIEKMKSVRGEPHGVVIANAAESIDAMGEGQRGSVLTTAQEHTGWIDNPMMARVLGTGKGAGVLRLDDLKDGNVSVYVCLPINAVTGPEGRWLRLFVLVFISVMMAEPERAPNPPVLLAIDEFPNLGRLDGIEVIAPVMRSYGVRFWAVGQDISQFKDVYPATWTGFIGGAEAVQFMGINHPPTVDFLSDLIGHHVVEIGMGTQVRKEAHPLMDRDQAMRFLAKDRGNQIIWFGSRRAMRLKVCPYFKYLMPWYYVPDPRYKESLWRRFLRWVGA